jgi:hypothetical protein
LSIRRRRSNPHQPLSRDGECREDFYFIERGWMTLARFFYKHDPLGKARRGGRRSFCNLLESILQRRNGIDCVGIKISLVDPL